MSAVATVTRITPTRKWDAARTEIGVVELEYEGGAYFCEYGNVFWPHGDNFIWLHSSPSWRRSS